MRFGGIDIASAIEKIVAAIVDEHGFLDVSDVITLGSSLHDDLGMDEVDLIEVLFRAEERFGLVRPDNEPRSPAAICMASTDCFPDVRQALAVVRPETVIRWHRAGFRAYWRWRSRPRRGRPKVPLEIRFSHNHPTSTVYAAIELSKKSLGRRSDRT